ncbi:MAG: DUF1549 domain-containing protein, partial [Verrucomicrobiota bacterium]
MLSGLTASGDTLDFNRHIRPILSDHCYQCHGPDETHRKARLRLDDEASAKAQRDGVAAIVAGHPDRSEMMARILSHDPDEQMPPPETEKPLTDEQKERLKEWIAGGAGYDQHWSFIPVRKPEVLEQGHPIDILVRERLKHTGLKPAGIASPAKLIRRVTFDLTGLPPTLSEMEAFEKALNQKGTDAAYEALVDRLLASPRYGEHMAWQWMEAARYADTDGYQNDGPRTMWRWRDWVIDAYNENMPFDRFTIEQLAGDLLPNPTHEQRIATAFNRHNRYNSEAGIPIDEFLLENAVDRVDTTSTVWMG